MIGGGGQPVPPAGAAPVGAEGLTAAEVTGSVAATPTGDPAIDAAVRAVAEGAGAPPADQLSRYEAAHRALQDALARIDES